MEVPPQSLHCALCFLLAEAAAVQALALLSLMRAFLLRLRRPGPLPPLRLRLLPSAPLPACRFLLAPALAADDICL